LQVVAVSVLAERASVEGPHRWYGNSVSVVLITCSRMEEATIPRLLRFVIARGFLQLTQYTEYSLLPIARVRSNKGRALVLFASKDLTCAFVTPTAKW
jgi:hypothetical protein